MGQAEDSGQEAARRGINIIIRLHAGEDEIVRQRPDGRREKSRVLARVEGGRIVPCDSDRFVRSLREGLPQHLFGPLRAQGHSDDAPSVFLLHPDGFFEGVLVRPVQLVIQRVPPDVLPVRSNLELKVWIWDLLEAHDDVDGHGISRRNGRYFNVPQWPPPPKVHELPTHPISTVRARRDRREREDPAVRRAGTPIQRLATRSVRAEAHRAGRALELHWTCRRAASGAKDVLDLGTGGGEVFETLCLSFTGRAVATEPWSVNAPVAAASLRPPGTEVVQCSRLRLPFRDSRLELVLCRHEELDPADTARVLAPGGRLLTQQIGIDRWQELRPFFPRMNDPKDLFQRYRRGLQKAGLTIVQALSHEWKAVYRGLGEIVFLLCIAPWEIPDFDPLSGDLAALSRAEESLMTNGGIVLTESLFLLEGWKSASSPPARSRR